jgi:hypothetical protein
MTKIIIVQKGGNLVEKTTNQLEETSLYKKCGLRSNNDFDHRHTWQVKNDEYISLFARDDGKANQENKYDLPPPLDNSLFFNKMLLVKHSSEEYDDDDVVDLSIVEWNNVYEVLFGGFESLNDEEEESSEEEIPIGMKTKQGYSKEGGFIVEDDEDVEYLSDGDNVLNDSDVDDSAVNDSDVNDSGDDSDIHLDNDSEVEEVAHSESDTSDDDSDYNSGNESELTEESYLSD